MSRSATTGRPRTRRARRAAGVLLAGLLAGSACAPAGEDAAGFPSRTIRIVAPANPGGGWDQTARALQRALREAGLVEQSVEVTNVPGAGGAIGLADLVNRRRGDPHHLLVTGLVMLGAVRANDAPVTLAQATPVASLTREWLAVVVPSASPYRTLAELVADFRADPRAVSWGGGSAGGTDHLLVGELARAVGVAPSGVNYVAHAGGGEATASLLSRAVTAGVSGVEEFRAQVEAGQLRVLAVSGEERVPGIDAPTLREAGYDVTMSNWRGLVAPPGLAPEDRAALVDLVERLHGTEEWREALRANGWEDFFLAGDEFERFLREEEARVERVLLDLGLAR